MATYSYSPPNYPIVVDSSPPPPQSSPSLSDPPQPHPFPLYLSPPPPAFPISPPLQTSPYSPPPASNPPPLPPPSSPPSPSCDHLPPTSLPPPPLPTPALLPPPPSAIVPTMSPPPLPAPTLPPLPAPPPPFPVPALPPPPPMAISPTISPPQAPSLPPSPLHSAPVTPTTISPLLSPPANPPSTSPPFPPPTLTIPPTTSPLHTLPILVSPPPKPHTPSTVLPSQTSRNFNANGRFGLNHSNSTSNNGTAGAATASIAALAGFVMLSFVGVAFWLVRKRKQHSTSGSAMPPPWGLSSTAGSNYPRFHSVPLVRHNSGSYGFSYTPSDSGIGNSRSWFTYEDLSMVTNGFSNLLGEGGFGPVYKGQLPNGRQVAVKQLKVGGSQGEREFRSEVETISRIHHRHLVSLVGYCISEHQKLLVYDYVPNDTLHYHLHGTGMPAMDWATRIKIAAGAARGIAYLHEDCHPRIIHRDIKSSNILLDNNFEAQVSDFGLARLAMDACTHVSTRVMGTFGYLAPEYASTGKLTAKSDVYSFGVVLLELITGRKPVDASQPLGDESLVEWARPLLSHALENGEIGELPDPRLEKRYNQKEMFCMIEAASSCIRHSSALRPRMGQVVRALGNLVDSDLTNGVRPGISREFESGPDTAEIEIFQRTRFTSQDCSSDFR